MLEESLDGTHAHHAIPTRDRNDDDDDEDKPEDGWMMFQFFFKDTYWLKTSFSRSNVFPNQLKKWQILQHYLGLTKKGEDRKKCLPKFFENPSLKNAGRKLNFD